MTCHYCNWVAITTGAWPPRSVAVVCGRSTRRKRGSGCTRPPSVARRRSRAVPNGEPVRADRGPCRAGRRSLPRRSRSAPGRSPAAPIAVRAQVVEGPGHAVLDDDPGGAHRGPDVSDTGPGSVDRGPRVPDDDPGRGDRGARRRRDMVRRPPAAAGARRGQSWFGASGLRAPCLRAGGGPQMGRRTGDGATPRASSGRGWTCGRGRWRGIMVGGRR